MLRTLSERYTERVIPISRRDTLDDVAQMFKSNTESSITSIGMGGTGSQRPYQEHAWVHACVKAIAKNVAQVPFKLRTKGANENLADSHELVKLFAAPNPLTSRFELWEGTESHLQLGGNAWWAAVPGSLEGRIAEIWVLSKKEVKPDIIAGVFRGWKVDWKGFKDYFLPGELIHFRYFNPYHPIMGMAPLEAARMSIDQDYWANRYNEAFFQNFAEPGVVLTAPGRLSPDQRKVMLATWEDRHRGFNRARKTALLEGGTTISDIGVSKRDMQFIEQKKLTRNEILSIFRVPPVEVMLVELVSSQVESQRAQRMLFGEEVIAPELAYIEDRLAAGFFAVHAPDVEGYFDTSEVSILQKSFEDKLKQAHQLWEMGYPINHINQKLELGFEDLAWGDVAWVPQNLVPITALMGITELPAKTPAATPPAKTLPPIAALPSGAEPDAIATHAPPAADAAAAASTEQVPVPAQVTRAAAAGGQDPSMIPPVVRREACVAQARPGILAESCKAPAAELDRKLQRYFFTLRNKVIRYGELDNIAYEGARLIDIAQPILQTVAMEVLDCERGAVRLSHQIAARFQETLPLIQANVQRDTTAVKHLFSLLKREAGRLARNAVAQTYQSAQELLARGMVLEWEEPEELNFDQHWRDYIVNVDRQERRYHKALLRWTDELQREYMTAFYGSRSILTRVGEPTLDWQAQTDKLAAASAGPVGEATEQGGQCKLLLPGVLPADYRSKVDNYALQAEGYISDVVKQGKLNMMQIQSAWDPFFEHITGGKSEAGERLRSNFTSLEYHWNHDPLSSGGQAQNCTAAKILGKDPNSEFVDAARRNTEILPEKVQELLLARKGFSEQIFLRNHADKQGTAVVVRGVRGVAAEKILADIDNGSKSVKLQINTLSSWTDKPDWARNYATGRVFAWRPDEPRSGVMISKIISKEDVWSIYRWTEGDEIILNTLPRDIEIAVSDVKKVIRLKPKLPKTGLSQLYRIILILIEDTYQNVAWFPIARGVLKPKELSRNE